jgi:hypothetical protein
MSLYSFEEICEGCNNAVFHSCCEKFCHCTLNLTQDANGMDNTCPGHSDEKRRMKPLAYQFGKACFRGDHDLK